VNDDTTGELIVQNTGMNGKCRKECSLAARACRSALDGAKVEKLQTLVQAKSYSVSHITKKICNSDSSSGSEKSSKKSKKSKATPDVAPCHSSHEHLAVNREWDEEFEPEDKKLSEMEDMMADMKAKTGMGMKMYSRDDLQGMSEGDMEAMAAREALAQERQEEHYRQTGGLGPAAEDL